MDTKSDLTQNLVSAEHGLAYINQLDLNYLESRLMGQLTWSKKKARETVRKYKNCLKLICKYPHFGFVPTLHIDEAWHNHILYTQQYTEDSHRIFGAYLHHTPKEIGENPARQAEINHHMHQSYLTTAALYELEFSEPYDKKFLIDSWH